MIWLIPAAFVAGYLFSSMVTISGQFEKPYNFVRKLALVLAYSVISFYCYCAEEK